MKSVIVRREQKMGVIGPIWYHHCGSKMRLGFSTLTPPKLIITGSDAKVVIAHDPAPDVYGLWKVRWEVIFSRDSRVNGRVFMLTHELVSAFGLKDVPGRYSDWLLERYGGDVAEQGKYIRWKDFLNIPGPGTGHDGDPNVSIYLNEDIKAAVRTVVEASS